MVDLRLYFSWISENIQKYWMLVVFTWNTIAARQKKIKVVKTYKELLGDCIKSKKTEDINTVCTTKSSKDFSN